ncbi:helix-turn-helix transcriptional regulator [Rufibacter ruber]|uniref:helix-turn-helix transcriptional regulator n=1 Tax=Rufibacter ruber TaxID=1783499 RepID=UPI00082C43A5|nr:helix-turn-helix transcriptional regulator [Rufibacter ruber]
MREDDIILEIYQLLNNPSPLSLHRIIEDRRDAMGLNNFQVAKILGVDKSTFNRQLEKLANGNVNSVDFFLILKLCQFLGIKIEDASKIFVASLPPDNIKELEMARKANYIISNFDVKGLKDQGFIDTATDFERIEERILKFFGLSSIFHYGTEVGAVAFSRTKSNSHDKMREFWVRSAIFQFEKIDNPNEYNPDTLLSLIPKMAPYTRYVEKGFHHVIQALFNIGVTVIVQSYLAKTQVRGGTFVVKGKPCIVITDFNKSYPHLWFALMHELYHVYYDFEQLKSLKYHLTGEAQSDLYLFREDYADLFGWEMLFPKEKRKYIKHMIKSEAYVHAYAKENMVHHGIIYASYCEERLSEDSKNEFGFYRPMFGSSEKALQYVKCQPWNKDSLLEEIEKIKKSFVVQ